MGTGTASPLLLLALAGACRGAAASLPSSGPGERVERRLTVMGTWLALGVVGPDRAAALRASEEAVRALESVEARLSTWREDSELARLNRAPVGEPVELSPELDQDLARARHFWLETGGAFDPGLGALVRAWGLREGGRQPSEAELVAARAAEGLAGFEFAAGRATRRHPLASIEEGGFGKGVGLDAAVEALRERGVEEAVLDLGGQVAVLGDGPVTYALSDPRERDRRVLELELGPGSLSTSGNSERGIVVDGQPRSHLLDPQSGAPAPDFGSLSVWSADATSADCLSTGLYVLGPQRAFSWARAHPGVELIVLTSSGAGLACLASEGWRGRIRPLVPELEISYPSDEPDTNQR